MLFDVDTKFESRAVGRGVRPANRGTACPDDVLVLLAAADEASDFAYLTLHIRPRATSRSLDLKSPAEAWTPSQPPSRSTSTDRQQPGGVAVVDQRLGLPHPAAGAGGEEETEHRHGVQSSVCAGGMRQATGQPAGHRRPTEAAGRLARARLRAHGGITP